VLHHVTSGAFSLVVLDFGDDSKNLPEMESSLRTLRDIFLSSTIFCLAKGEAEMQGELWVCLG
jgi:hypothetical protein